MKTQILFALFGAALLVGCSATAEETEEGVESSSEALSAPTCAPSIASGAVPGKHLSLIHI